MAIALDRTAAASFRSWRLAARNLVDYRRRECRHWRTFGLHAWLCRDGHIRGIVILGLLTPYDVQAAFGARWPTTLRPMDPADLRTELYRIVHPGMIATDPPLRGRYQRFKLAIWPRRHAGRATVELPRSAVHVIEPMPIIF